MTDPAVEVLMLANDGTDEGRAACYDAYFGDLDGSTLCVFKMG